MKRIGDYQIETLEWRQPKGLDHYYELRARQELLARLTFRSLLGTLATAETSEGSWTFKRVGFLNPRVTVREAGQEANLAVYQPKFWGDGVLTFQDGRALTWKPVNFWRTDWSFFNAQEDAVLEFISGLQEEKLRDVFKTQYTLIRHGAGPDPDILPILATLGLYLLILHQQDAAAAMAGTSAAT
ncbi:MAG: hypothetical protein JSV61_12755 [Anaerolineales bacterium]|nr:MAG: hypothetical protein JSV61_12755 [Anaerolineales bacterium]